MLSCFERSQPASQLARSGVDRIKGRRRSGDREDMSARDSLRYRSLWPTPLGVNPRGPRCCPASSARNLLRNLLALA
jgi:hypothetical protein